MTTTTKDKATDPQSAPAEAPSTGDLRELLRQAAATGELKALIAEAEAEQVRELTPGEQLAEQLADGKWHPATFATVLRELDARVAELEGRK